MIHPLPSEKVTLRRRLSYSSDTRSQVIFVSLLTLLLAVSWQSLAGGTPGMSVNRILLTLSGAGSARDEFILITVRMPRLLTALLAGCALACAGAVFQSLTRNPLGSPDIMGFNAGAATGGLISIFVFNAVGGYLVIGALSGGFLTAAAIYLLTIKNGINGNRLVLVGIGVSPLLMAVNAYILTRANVNKAQEAAFWLTGSLNGAGWEDVTPLVVSISLLVAALFILRRHLSVLEMGDELAYSLGTHVVVYRLLALIVGVGLTSTACASAGPISFVALIAPHIARTLARKSSIHIALCSIIGALLLSASDLIAQRAFDQTSLPVGVVTGAVGGFYMASWLLIAMRRNMK